MKPLTVLSLFDGMSCGQQALDKAKIPVEQYIASEIDTHAMNVTRYNYPDTIFIGDVRNIDVSKLPKIDLILAGSPCVNLSFAGRGEGMSTDENIEITSLKQYLKLKKENFKFKGQSYLFWEFIRIKEELNKKQKSEVMFLLENVQMVNKWKNIFNETVGSEPIFINSSILSAQTRKRYYWINSNKGFIEPKDLNINTIDILDDQFKESIIINGAMRGRYLENGKRKDAPVGKSNAGKTKQYIEIRLDGKTNCLTTVQKDNVIVYFNNQEEINKKRYEKEELTYRFLTISEMEKLQTLIKENYTQYSMNIDGKCILTPKTARQKMIGNGWTVDIIVYLLEYLILDKHKKGE